MGRGVSIAKQTIVVITVLLAACQGARLNDDRREEGMNSMTGGRTGDEDIKHLQSHLDGYADIDVSKLSKEERDFYFFSLHDIDQDGALDGWEMLDALGHIAEEDYYVKTHLREKFGNDTKVFTQKFLDYVSDGVDKILLDDDLNEDGYIQYAEHRRSVRRYWTEDATDIRKTGHA